MILFNCHIFHRVNYNLIGDNIQSCVPNSFRPSVKYILDTYVRRG